MSATVVVSVAVLFSSGCGKSRERMSGDGHGSGHGGSGATDSVGGEAGSPEGGSAGVSGGATGGSGGSGGSAGSPPLSTGGVKMRLLTQAEYLASLQSLFGAVTTPLALPDDMSVAGFVSIGASKVTVNATAAYKYEVASRAVVAEVFGDAERWQALVGCEPEADFSDDCLETFLRSFGKRAYRRDLSDAVRAITR